MTTGGTTEERNWSGSGVSDVWRGARIPLTVSLVTTASADGSMNASPKNWFTPVSYEPPTVAVSVRKGSDTNINLRQNGVFVLHLPGSGFDEEVLHTAKRLPYGLLELDDVGLIYEVMEVRRLDDWEGDRLKLPYLPYVPWFLCDTLDPNPSSYGDHDLFVAEVRKYGGFSSGTGVDDVLVHRGRNVFVELGKEYEVKPY